MTANELKTLSNKELDERISSTMDAHKIEGHLAFVAERSRRAGFDIDQTLECVLDAAQRENYLAYGDIPDQLARSWSQRRYQIPGHLQDLILYCRIKKLPLLSSIIVEKKNVL